MSDFFATLLAGIFGIGMLMFWALVFYGIYKLVFVL